MATYDLLMLAILVGLTLYGYFKGMAWQVAYLASFVASAILASKFADRIAPQVTQFTGVEPPWNKFLAMALIYAVASFAIWMVFRVVSNMIDRVKMDGFDHQMGAFLGFGRGVLWCVGVTFLVLTVAPVPDVWKQGIVNSKSGYYIARLIDETDSVFPPEVHQVIDPYLNRLGNELDGAQPGGVPQPPAANGWPGAAPAGGGQSAPAWGQAAAPSAPAWPGSAPAAAPWPQASQPAAPAGGDFAWPADNSAVAPTTPASPASWPSWDN